MFTDLLGMGGLRGGKAPTISKESSPLIVVLLCFTAVIPLLGKRPVFIKNELGTSATCKVQQQICPCVYWA
jgi:hypothetical protein